MYFYALTVGYRYSQSCLDVQKVRLPKFYLEVSGMTWHIFHLFFNSPMLPSPMKPDFWSFDPQIKKVLSYKNRPVI